MSDYILNRVAYCINIYDAKPHAVGTIWQGEALAKVYEGATHEGPYIRIPLSDLREDFQLYSAKWELLHDPETPADSL